MRGSIRQLILFNENLIAKLLILNPIIFNQYDTEFMPGNNINEINLK